MAQKDEKSTGSGVQIPASVNLPPPPGPRPTLAPMSGLVKRKNWVTELKDKVAALEAYLSMERHLVKTLQAALAAEMLKNIELRKVIQYLHQLNQQHELEEQMLVEHLPPLPPIEGIPDN